MICLSLYALIASATFLACAPVCYRQATQQCGQPHMICVSLLSLLSVATLIACTPLCSRGLFNRRCTCPEIPICPDCGTPY
ncbi:unnamed protein product [Danaus chrysippus]|uniref:(African queen) hypothetical protein n=1 Tax=Danaus chrysippus TaxID=151541 RepID=A0A8J2QVR9_9NEOP|nr:unnamed protein product [Danaus chrysippus]